MTIKTIEMPKRIQRRRTKGWRMPPDAIYVGRPTQWGNPFSVHQVGQVWRVTHAGVDDQPFATQQDAITVSLLRYQQWAIVQSLLQPDWLAALRGQDLACWCQPNAPCHADILLDLANQTEQA